MGWASWVYKSGPLHSQAVAFWDVKIENDAFMKLQPKKTVRKYTFNCIVQ